MYRVRVLYYDKEIISNEMTNKKAARAFAKGWKGKPHVGYVIIEKRPIFDTRPFHWTLLDE